MGDLFNTVLYQPLFNLLIFFYNLIPDIGISIILLTLVIKAILWPLSHKGLKSQKALQDLQPKMDALKEKHKDNKEKLGQEMMSLYKREKINPLSSCLPLLIQLPVIIAVFRVFRTELTDTNFDLLYSFIANPGSLNPIMLGIVDLAKPQIVLAVLAGLAQFWHSMLLMKKKKSIPTPKSTGMAQTMSKQMMYFMPIITVFIAASFPGGLALYWLVMTLLNVLDQYIINRSADQNISQEPPKLAQPEIIDSK